MLARLIACALIASPHRRPTWRFEIEVHEAGGTFLTKTVTLPSIHLIAESDKAGPLYDLCRAIRDAEERDYETFIGKDFGAH